MSYDHGNVSEGAAAHAMLEVLPYNHDEHYMQLFNMSLELKSYGEYLDDSDEDIPDELLEKVDQTVVDYLKGTHLLVCFAHDDSGQRRLAGLLSASVTPYEDIKAKKAASVDLTALQIQLIRQASSGNSDSGAQNVSTASLLEAALASARSSSPDPQGVDGSDSSSADGDGSAGGSSGQKTRDPGCYLYVNRIYVRPGHRHQGVATSLIHSAIELGSSLEKKCHNVIIATIASYQAALSLYQHCGFVITGQSGLPSNLKAKPGNIYLNYSLDAQEQPQ